MRNAQLFELIKRPLLTEKAATMSQDGQYAFEVLPEANKIDLASAFELLFPGRKVLNVRTIKIYPKTKRRGRKVGHTSVGKKAIFTIQGEPIEIFTGGAA